jgi:membrane protease YdiL (CAAX protease family)
VGQRLRFVVLAGELAGPEEALRRLHDLRAKIDKGEVKGEPEDVALLPVLERLYHDYQGGHLDAPSVSAVERERLRHQFGWFGQLALAPRDGPDKEARAAVLASAQRTAVVVLGVVGTVMAVGMFGLVGLVLLLVLLFLGQLGRGITGAFEYGGVYAETFALWMGLFVGLSFAASRLDLPGPPLLLAAAVPLASWALALCWPLLRGVPFRRLREDAGLTFGRNPPLEPALGVVGYAISLPILGVGVLLIVAAMHLQQSWYAAHPDAGPPEAPTHPIVQVLGNLDWRLLLQLLLLASVVAPLVEETMFRGLLYRHLREATGHWGRFTSALFSACVVSFVFAVIHPQGWLGIPALMALALGFSLMREWRGTLIPSMVAHGINNGVLMLFFYFALAG